MNEIADILDRAADLIEPEGAWRQGGFGNTETKCWCARGAIISAGARMDGPAEVQFARHLFGLSGRPHQIALWNDEPERTQVEVVSELREAAAKARTPQYALKNGRV